MADADKVRVLLGFARKAGKLAIGRSAVIKAYKQKTIALAVLATDATPKAQKIVEHLQGVSTVQFGTKNELGDILGRNEVGMIGILDHQFAASLRHAMKSKSPSDDASEHTTAADQ